MSTWRLFEAGELGALRFGMTPSEVLDAFGDADNWATDRKSEITILKYNEVELHFYGGELGLVHAEVRANDPTAFDSSRLGIALAAVHWPVDFDALAHTAAANGVAPAEGVDTLGRRELRLGFGRVTDCDDTVVVSVLGPVLTG